MKDLNFPLVNLANDGELRTSSEAIALGFGVQHKNVMALLRQHQTYLAAFGHLAFETRVVNRPQGGGTPVEFALLTERQAMLLVTLMRNTAKVLAFKVRLVSEFAKMADSLHNRDLTMWQRRIRLEQKDASSRAKASYGSHLMLDRRRELPALDAERHLLESSMNPPLFKQ